MKHFILITLLAWLAAGCAPTYQLVRPETAAVANGNLTVRPTLEWNKLPGGTQDIKNEESWTRNGPMLDLVSFIAGVEDGEPIAKQRKKEDRKVPVFKANMSPPELAAMIESYYAIRAGISIFNVTGMQPATFLGSPGMRLDYDYVGRDDVKRRGRAVLAVIDERFYMMALEGTALHYFEDSLPEFEAMVASASR